jgi:hypothetical protein
MDFLDLIIGKDGRIRKSFLGSRLRPGEVRIQRYDDGSVVIGLHKDTCLIPEKKKVVRFHFDKKQLKRLLEIISK